MKKITLIVVSLLFTGITGYTAIRTISNNGNLFTPSSVTISDGDTIVFTISVIHDAREVSQATWNANGNTALSGGFQTPFGGGMVLPAKLAVGTHYYVCTPHASMGMKGTIVVQSITTGLPDNPLADGLSVFPNPSTGKFFVSQSGQLPSRFTFAEVFTLKGEAVFQTSLTNSITEVDLHHHSPGFYLVKLVSGEAVLTRKIMIR